MVHLEVAQVLIDHQVLLQEVVLAQYALLAVLLEVVRAQLDHQGDPHEAVVLLVDPHRPVADQAQVVLREEINCNTQLKENEKINTHIKSG